MAHTHSGSYETHSRASSMSNWERLRGRASTAGGGGQGDMVREQHFNISLGSWWSNHSDTVGKLTPLFFFSLSFSHYTLRASWFTSPSRIIMDDGLFLFFFSILNADESQFNGYATVYREIKGCWFCFFLLLHILKTYNPALKIRDNQQEQANTQIQHYIRVYLLWLSIDNS